MDWIKDFYTHQEEWAGVNRRPVSETDLEKAALISRHTGSSPKTILELGAGGGQAAFAAAEAGNQVTAVELNPEFSDHIRQLASRVSTGSLQVINANFFDLALDERFDVVCYWDGFGIGEDTDQIKLLQRIASWLKPEGTALIDVYTPWYWAITANGQQMEFGSAVRKYEFDAGTCRMLDHWWLKGQPQTRRTQSLRCYSPADLQLLLRESGLTLTEVHAGAAVDYEQHTFTPHAPLEKAMSFLAVLKHHTG